MYIVNKQTDRQTDNWKLKVQDERSQRLDFHHPLPSQLCHRVTGGITAGVHLKRREHMLDRMSEKLKLVLSDDLFSF